MKRAVCILAVVIAGWCIGHARASASSSGGAIDPVFPSAQASLQQSYPQAQSSWDLTTPEVQRLIEERLTSESALENARIDVKTDDGAVLLTGKVASERQRELASEIAKAFAGNRRIENQIEVRGI